MPQAIRHPHAHESLLLCSFLLPILPRLIRTLRPLQLQELSEGQSVFLADGAGGDEQLQGVSGGGYALLCALGCLGLLFGGGRERVLGRSGIGRSRGQLLVVLLASLAPAEVAELRAVGIAPLVAPLDGLFGLDVGLSAASGCGIELAWRGYRRCIQHHW